MFLTKEKYLERIQEINVKNKHWDDRSDRRWVYHEAAIDVMRERGCTGAKHVLEFGSAGMEIVPGSDTFDINTSWTYEGMNPTYLRNMRSLPWPIQDKQYEWAVALRVFQHLTKDQELLSLARSEAIKILQADPALSQTEHVMLKKAFTSLLQHKNIWNYIS
jgi:hypothetical protein